MAKTEGVYPFVAGGSPIASPTSLCAIANLVTESIIRITFLPLSLKYSAIAVAVNAPFRRTSAGLSDVAQTTILFFKPSRSEEHTSELQSRQYLVCRLLLEKKKKKKTD